MVLVLKKIRNSCNLHELHEFYHLSGRMCLSKAEDLRQRAAVGMAQGRRAQRTREPCWVATDGTGFNMISAEMGLTHGFHEKIDRDNKMMGSRDQRFIISRQEMAFDCNRNTRL